ncbi:baculoviral IAP repeat-containing protein 3-like [Clavelina lepadiformis]|uniref:baculoviral IAP repeat-containing protein 3-like n=1 Tax=Clavelina lepadiformis TaxID=159417 RepID=UPI004041229E
MSDTRFQTSENATSMKTGPLNLRQSMSDKRFNEETKNVVADGRNYERQKDPPGQKSVYILPGDANKETYRLSTFKKFPEYTPVNPCLLAAHGFLYTGYKDRVKCFSCGAQVQEWEHGDDPRSLKWHRPNCLLVMGKDHLNVAISCRPVNFRIEAPRVKTDSIDSGYSSATSSIFSNGSYYMTKEQAVTKTQADFPGQKILENMNSFQLSCNNVSSTATTGGRSPVQTANAMEMTTSHLEGLELANIISSEHKALITIQLDLKKENDRRKSFETWTSTYTTVTPMTLAKSGFFYLGNLDRVQCFSCSGVLRNWRSGDDVPTEHRRHFLKCKMSQNIETRNVPLPPQTSDFLGDPVFGLPEPPDPSPAELAQLKVHFPCLNPVNPHMRREEMRLDTFDRRWPSAKVKATKQQIAKAGFFFLGQRDRTKCWYCNGGLQNWDPNDEPWTEHAKWFPGCEFVLRRKGMQFVKDLFNKYPNLPRPVLRNSRFDTRTARFHFSDPTPVLPPRSIMCDPHLVPSAGAVLSGASMPVLSSSSVVVADEMMQQRERNLVDVVVKMGFNKHTAQRLVNERKFDTGVGFTNAEELVEVLLSTPDLQPELDEDSLMNATSQEETASDGECHGDVTGTSMSVPEQITKQVTTGGRKQDNKDATSSAVHQGFLKRRDDHDIDSTITSRHLNNPTSTKLLKSDQTQRLAVKLKQLERARQCKLCYQKVAVTLITPCGHLALCHDCSLQATQCPLCKRKAEKLIRAYMV